MPWLTEKERELPRHEKITLRRTRRRARNLERWPKTDGRPPWLVKAEVVLLKLAGRAVVILGNAATAAVLEAAAATLAGGQARHAFAVASLLKSAGAHAITLGTTEAAELIEGAYELLGDGGGIDDAPAG